MNWPSIAPRAHEPDWELASESVSVKIRWFGLVIGVLIVAFGSNTQNYFQLYAILGLGLVFTSFDTFFSRKGRIFLRDYPVVIAAMEALFITLLCHFESGPESPFRFYYLLSLICSAIRYSPKITFFTCGLDCIGYTILFAFETDSKKSVSLLVFTIVMLVWISWTAAALAKLLKQTGETQRTLNEVLRQNQTQLEMRIAERTKQLEDSQAQVLHQEKMAGFGLLAAGIAHEVGNPLTSISSVVQILESRGTDEYTKDKLHLVTGQLARIQGILRELVTFSRPASDRRGAVSISKAIEEALGIAKYYRGGKSRKIESQCEENLSTFEGVNDQIVQVIFNLVLNAIDATDKAGIITVIARQTAEHIIISISDNGTGIEPTLKDNLFRPYYTTKKHGTGLGLFVTRKIIEQHQGRIECDSKIGLGTTFQVKFPIAGSPNDTKK